MRNQYIIILILLLALSSGCLPHEKLLNFDQGTPFPSGNVDINRNTSILIKSADELAINVYSQDMLAVSAFNPGSSVEASDTEQFLYKVDSNGYIDFPVVGSVFARGLSLNALKDTIKVSLEEYIKSPIIQVKLMNFHITVLGEVTSPSTYPILSESLTILDAIGLSGDLTDYANRSNVLVIRESEGKRSFGRLNLKDREVFESDYFYLQQNDVVVVEPLKEKAATVRTQAQNLVPWLAVLTSLATLVVTITR